MEPYSARPAKTNGPNGLHGSRRPSSVATISPITDDDLLHLAIAYVKNAHGTSPDFLTRVAVVLEALREGRGEWERSDSMSAASRGSGSFGSNGYH